MSLMSPSEPLWSRRLHGDAEGVFVGFSCPVRKADFFLRGVISARLFDS